MSMKPEKNQIGWGITLFCVAVAVMLAYYVIFDGKDLLRSLGNIIDSLSGVIIGIIIAYLLIPIQDSIEKNILKPIYKKKGYDISLLTQTIRSVSRCELLRSLLQWHFLS